MQLRHNNTLSTIDNECTILCHIRNWSEEYILDNSSEILMIRVGAIQLELSLEGYAVSQTTLETLVDGVTGRVDVVIQELKNEIITCIGDREVL